MLSFLLCEDYWKNFESYGFPHSDRYNAFIALGEEFGEVFANSFKWKILKEPDFYFDRLSFFKYLNFVIKDIFIGKGLNLKK